MFLDDFLSDFDADDSSFGAEGEGIFTSKDNPEYGFRPSNRYSDTTKESDQSFD